MYKVLIVEDDEIISKTIMKHAEGWGYEVLCSENFKDVLSDFVRFAPHLVLLDISLPFYNGYHWCIEIRKISKVPIMFISSASDNLNIVMAMNMGADDFISKPFDLTVLISKIHALMRRSYDFAGQSNLLEHNGVILDKDSFSVTFGGKTVELTKNEGKIMIVLMEHVGKSVSRDVIIKRLWETDSYIEDNTLTVNVTRLRKKLQNLGISDFISSQKGMGYIIK